MTALEQARQIVADRRYTPGTPCYRGVLSGQWDGGQLVRDALTEVEARG